MVYLSYAGSFLQLPISPYLSEKESWFEIKTTILYLHHSYYWLWNILDLEVKLPFTGLLENITVIIKKRQISFYFNLLFFKTIFYNFKNTFLSSGSQCNHFIHHTTIQPRRPSFLLHHPTLKCRNTYTFVIWNAQTNSLKWKSILSKAILI